MPGFEQDLADALGGVDFKNDKAVGLALADFLDTRGKVIKEYFSPPDMPATATDPEKLIYDGIKDSANYAKAAAWAGACAGMVDHSIAAAEAARRGDSYAMGAQIMQAFGSFTGIICTMGGPWGLGIGTALGILSGFASNLISAFGPPQKSMDQIIKELLKEERAKDIALKLKSAAETFDNAAPALMTMDDNKHTFQEVIAIENFMTGPGELRLEDGHMWLVDPENQKLEVWDKVFVAYFAAVRIHVIDMLLASTKVKQHKHGKPLEPSEHKVQMFATIWWMFQKLEKICSELAPVIANRGGAWHIGDNRKLYTRDHAVGSGAGWPSWDNLAGASDSLVVSAKSERLWTVVRKDWFDRDVPYTRPGTRQTATRPYTYVENGILRAGFAHRDSDEVDSSASHCSVLRGTKGREIVAVVSGSDLDVRTWDESRTGKTKWVTMSPERTTLAEHTIHQVSGVSIPAAESGDSTTHTITDRFYVLAKKGTEWTLQYTNYEPTTTTRANGMSPLSGWAKVTGRGVHSNNVAGITADEKHLVAFGPTTIWRLRHADATNSKVDWEVIASPAESFAEIKNNDWWYQDVYASKDGSLLAIIKRKVYLWHATTKTWTRNEDADALKVFKLPVEGEDVFRQVRTMIDEKLSLFKTGKDLNEVRAVLKGKGILAEKDGKVTGLQPAWLTAKV